MSDRKAALLSLVETAMGKVAVASGDAQVKMNQLTKMMNRSLCIHRVLALRGRFDIAALMCRKHDSLKGNRRGELGGNRAKQLQE